MVSHDRHEASPLHPSHLKFFERYVPPVVIMSPSEESSYVGVPVRDTAEAVVESRRNLRPHHIPIGNDVSAPAERTVALLAERR